MGKTKTAFVSEGQNLPADATHQALQAGKNQKKHEKAHKEEAKKVHLAGLKGGQRVKMVGAEIPPEQAATETTEKAKGSERGHSAELSRSPKRVERIRSKKYQEVKKKFDNSKTYSAAEAIKLVKETSYSKFDGTMELHMSLKKVGVSAQVALPHQAGRTKKVEVATDATVEKLKAGKIDFDILVATASMMPKLIPFARLLGPKGLMPNPKNGTLVTDAKKAQAFSAGIVTLKTEKEAPLVHAVIGKVSQDGKELAENLEAIFKALGGTKQIYKAYLKATMGPSVKVKV